MKTAINIHSENIKEQRVSSVRLLFKRIAKFIDDLVVKYYYKGERLRPEVWERIQQAKKDAKGGKNVSPVFTDVNEAFDWLDAQKQ